MSSNALSEKLNELAVPHVEDLSADALAKLGGSCGDGEEISNETFEAFARGLSEEFDAPAAASTSASAKPKPPVPHQEKEEKEPAPPAPSVSAAAASAATPSAGYKAILRPGASASKVIYDVPFTLSPNPTTSEGLLKQALYGSNRQQFDTYLPAPEGVNENTVVHFHVHGGGWIRGCRSANNLVKSLGSDKSVYGAPQMCHSFASMGGVAIATGYRVGNIKEIMVDVVMSLKHISAKSNLVKIDPALSKLKDDFKIVLSGHSAGAHVVMLLATDPTFLSSACVDPARICGVIGVSGPYTVRNPFAGSVSNWRNFVFQRTYISNKAFPSDLREQDHYSPTWRLAQRAKDPSALERYFDETREAPGFFETGCSTEEVREQPEQLKKDLDNAGNASKAVAAAAAAGSSPAALGSPAQGFGKSKVDLPPTLLESHGVPVIILCALSDLGLENDSQRIFSFLSKLDGYDLEKKGRYARVAGTHASINREPTTRAVLVNFMNEIFFK